MIKTKCAKGPWRFLRRATRLMAEVRGVKWLISVHSSISPLIKSVLCKSNLINGTLGIWSRQILPPWFIISGCFHSDIHHRSPRWRERFLFKCQAEHFPPTKHKLRCNYDMSIICGTRRSMNIIFKGSSCFVFFFYNFLVSFWYKIFLKSEILWHHGIFYFNLLFLQ